MENKKRFYVLAILLLFISAFSSFDTLYSTFKVAEYTQLYKEKLFKKQVDKKAMDKGQIPPKKIDAHIEKAKSEVELAQKEKQVSDSIKPVKLAVTKNWTRKSPAVLQIEELDKLWSSLSNSMDSVKDISDESIKNIALSVSLYKDLESANQHLPIANSISKELLLRLKLLEKENTLEGLALIDAYLSLYEFWLKRRDVGICNSFEQYIPLTLKFLENSSRVSLQNKFHTNIKNTVMVGMLFQKMATLPIKALKEEKIVALKFIADAHITKVLQMADLTMGAPLWQSSSYIPLNVQGEQLYYISMYKQCGGALMLPFDRKQTEATMSLFHERKANKDIADNFYYYSHWIYKPDDERANIPADLKDVALIAITSKNAGNIRIGISAIEALQKNYKVNTLEDKTALLYAYTYYLVY